MVESSRFSLFNAKLYPQWIAASGVTLLLLQVGAMCGWTSPYLARLTVPDSPIYLTLEKASWVASLLNVGRFVGAVVGALCVEFWGSKNAIIHTLIPIILSWILIIVANDPLMLYIARIFGGLGLGMAFSCFPLYIGEIALPQIRGAMIALSFCGSPFGSLLASLIGNYLSMMISGIIFFVICMAGVALFLWLPDSPHHLVKVGNSEAARKSIDWYRSGDQVDKELETVQNFVLSSSTKSFKDKLNDLSSPSIKKALFIIIMLFIYMQISGLNSILFYMEIIFARGKCNVIRPSLAVLLINVIGFYTALLSINLIDKCGRRVLLIISGAGITVSMLSLGTHFLLIDYGFDPKNFQWLLIFAIFLFIITFIFGLMPVPSAVLSELFPANVKSTAACVASLAGALFAFGSSKTYQPLVDFLGEAYVFYIYAVLIVTIIPFVLLFVPETKGKSLQEIQDDLMKN